MVAAQDAAGGVARWPRCGTAPQHAIDKLKQESWPSLSALRCMAMARNVLYTKGCRNAARPPRDYPAQSVGLVASVACRRRMGENCHCAIYAPTEARVALMAPLPFLRITPLYSEYRLNSANE